MVYSADITIFNIFKYYYMKLDLLIFIFTNTHSPLTAQIPIWVVLW